MNKKGEKKTFFSVVIVVILIIFIYLFVKSQTGYSLGSVYSGFDNSVIKLISFGAIAFVGFLILRAFVRMFSANV